MASEEDVLLREVDEDLQREQTFDRLRKYRVPLIAGAVAAVSGVSAYQFLDSRQAQASARAAEAYAEVSFAADSPVGAERLQDFADDYGSGYGTLAAFRAAAELGAEGDLESAAELYGEIYSDTKLSAAMRDFARLRAAYLLLDRRPDEASSIASLIETDAFRPHAEEVISGAALASGSYRAARAGFEALAQAETTPQGMRARAQTFAAVADAALAGASVEAPAGAESPQSFIERFGSELEAAGAPVGADPGDLLTPFLEGEAAAAGAAPQGADEADPTDGSADAEPDSQEPPQ